MDQVSKEFGENKGISHAMKALGKGQNGASKEHPAWHFEVASLAATAFLKITSAYTKGFF
jgi:hypothetical protein